MLCSDGCSVGVALPTERPRTLGLPDDNCKGGPQLRGLKLGGVRPPVPPGYVGSQGPELVYTEWPSLQRSIHGQGEIRVPDDVPRYLMVPHYFSSGPVEGVYKKVIRGIYFQLHYTSQPASGARDFIKEREMHRFVRKRKQTTIPELMFGSIIVNENVYNAFDPSKEENTIKGGLLFPVQEIPENYLNSVSIETSFR